VTSGVHLGVQVSNNSFCLEASVLSENSWDNLEGSTELLDGVLVKTWLLLGELLNLVSQVDLGCGGTSNESVISN